MKEIDTEYTKIFFGNKGLEKIDEICKKLNPRKILLVSGSRSMERLGVIDKIKGYLSKYEVFVTDKVESNPGIEAIEEIIRFAKKANIDTVISLGGGSSIDVGKSVAILSKNNNPLREILKYGEGIINRGLPFIAIPTTAGTGSEVTKWATVWDKKIKKKYSLSHDYMYPKVALLDPSLTLSLPKYVTATTGFDALSHAIEAFWSIYSKEESDRHAREAIELINIYLEKVCSELDNIEYREKMMFASLKAGLAFSQTKTTAVHSVSYPMTAYYNIPHGLACGLLLPSFLDFNYGISDEDCMDKRGPSFVKRKIEKVAKTLDCESISEASSRIREIMKNIGLPLYLKDAGIKDIDLIIRNSFTLDRVGNNPRKVTGEALRRILSNIYEEKI